MDDVEHADVDISLYSHPKWRSDCIRHGQVSVGEGLEWLRDGVRRIVVHVDRVYQIKLTL